MHVSEKKPQTKYQISVDNDFIETEYGLSGTAGRCKPRKLHDFKTSL